MIKKIIVLALLTSSITSNANLHMSTLTKYIYKTVCKNAPSYSTLAAIVSLSMFIAPCIIDSYNNQNQFICISKKNNECKNEYTFSKAFQEKIGTIRSLKRTFLVLNNISIRCFKFRYGPEKILERAIRWRNPELVKSALANGADVNCINHRCSNNDEGPNNYSPLTEAMRMICPDYWNNTATYTIIQLLLDAGAQLPIETIKLLYESVGYPLESMLAEQTIPINIIKQVINIIPADIIKKGILIPYQKRNALTYYITKPNVLEITYFPHNVRWDIINMLLDHGMHVRNPDTFFINYTGNEHSDALYETGKRLNVDFNAIATEILTSLENDYPQCKPLLSKDELAQCKTLHLLLEKGHSVDISKSTLQNLINLIKTAIASCYNNHQDDTSNEQNKIDTRIALKTFLTILNLHTPSTIAETLNIFNTAEREPILCTTLSDLSCPINGTEIVEQALIHNYINTLHLIHIAQITYKTPSFPIIEKAYHTALKNDDEHTQKLLIRMFNIDKRLILKKAKEMKQWDIVGILLQHGIGDPETDLPPIK